MKLLVWADISLHPSLQPWLEYLQVPNSPQVWWKGIVVMGTPVSEAVLRKITLVPEGLIHPDTPSTVLPSPVGVVRAQPAGHVVWPATDESLVHH